MFADKLQIERAIENLIFNALTYAPDKTIISISLSCINNCVSFSVSNKCHFIPDKELKNIFNKYSKTVNSKLNRSSTGLGLYTAKQIILLHGGKIYAKCSKDGTCTFCFKLKNKIPAKDYLSVK